MTKGISKCQNCGEEWDTLQLIEYEATPYNKKYCIFCIEAVRTYISTIPQLRKSISALNKVISGLHSINAPDELVEKVGEPIIELSSNMNQLDILLQSIKRDAPVLYNYERESIKNGEREIHITHIPDDRLDNPMRCVEGGKVWSSEQCR